MLTLPQFPLPITTKSCRFTSSLETTSGLPSLLPQTGLSFPTTAPNWSSPFYSCLATAPQTQQPQCYLTYAIWSSQSPLTTLFLTQKPETWCPKRYSPSHSLVTLLKRYQFSFACHHAITTPWHLWIPFILKTPWINAMYSSCPTQALLLLLY